MLDKEPDEFRFTSPVAEIWQLFRRNKVALMCGYLLLALLLLMLFAPLIAPHDINMQFVGQELLPPSWNSEGKISFFLGTDDLGRDLLSRIIVGLRYTFGSSLIVALLTLLIGGVLGVIAGTGQGIKSNILGHFLDAFLSIPILLLAIIIATLRQPSLLNAILAILLASLPYFIHQVYLALQSEINKEYVIMLRLDGASKGYLISKVMLPNLLPVFIRLTSRIFTLAMLDISALSFIALGAQPPLPEWGALIRESIDLIYVAPWLSVLPGFALIFVIITSLLFSDGLAKAIERYYHKT
ncbi:ABC transporter permease subunit [Testudinibacter sp. TR-2022]|uniref:ABC transporter permease subunit n=1 Tax=Testudinibacter sp. TR-2022 TaxID=2585029 RepID=UPI00111A2865|nr:ABC transporter permease subunit [Testudinibacter sp. TR-2022]TNH05407.1 ABC transporter permease subunit [Pasteurellaceae bacterium Phil31]TNH12094.1 ABC transporter permease subunit [Testudinibacter sp. TR-2022]TNH13270.1 ABC transporter permease subunit [Testudinibacter sp. TR-2022]TNH13540.1 ABC transporter permease subunit [Testudinibacter sp. TR-2022]TNH17371.1 ABC transporter permease subunit [Testudinibacter sp. TR-2022]